MTDLPSHSISLLIPTYNRYEMTDLCLRAVKEYSNFDLFKEVIVVDCHSTDGTEKLIEATPWIDTIIKTDYGSVQRSMLAGLDASTGEYIIKLDNDMLVSNQWNSYLLETLLAARQLTEYEVIGFAQAVNVQGKRLGYVEQCLAPKIALDGCSHKILPVDFIGGNFICHRSVLDGLYLHQGGDKQYGGWWSYHRRYYAGKVGYIWPRLDILDMGILGNPDKAPAEARLQEPLVQEAITTCGIADWRINLSFDGIPDLIKRYVAEGWMRT